MEIKNKDLKFKVGSCNLKIREAQMIRRLSELKSVLYDQKWAEKAADFPVYYVWRGIRETKYIRYDITIIPAQMLGKEFPKTKGHHHINHFPELIKVLEGQAIYFSQKGRGKDVKDCWAIRAKKGDFVLIPPDVEHLTINPGKRALVMANWMCKGVKSDYSLFEKMQGACYYYTKQGWLKNKNYKNAPRLRFERPFKEFSLTNLKSLLCK
ncbi:MAG TPA: glucose-6-phosphate isomerase [Candidatus Parcubacteria bacterium]|nr:glucose-6-phosphate isomerase [Candidatus Parcubacteria bacterium]